MTQELDKLSSELASGQSTNADLAPRISALEQTVVELKQQNAALQKALDEKVCTIFQVKYQM